MVSPQGHHTNDERFNLSLLPLTVSTIQATIPPMVIGVCGHEETAVQGCVAKYKASFIQLKRSTN